jgi:hypothetical protein
VTEGTRGSPKFDGFSDLPKQKVFGHFSFAERTVDWRIVPLEKFLMSILEKGPNNMLFQQQGGSAYTFSHCSSGLLESKVPKGIDQQTQPYPLATSLPSTYTTLFPLLAVHSLHKYQ